MSHATASEKRSKVRQVPTVPWYRKRSLAIAVEIAVPVALLVTWWFASANSTSTFFPPLSKILTRFGELWFFDHFASDIMPSVGNLFAGFIIGGTLGVLMGVVLAQFRRLGWLLVPIIDFARAIPPVALVPIFVALFGFGNEVRVGTIAIAALFPTLISTIDGMRSIDSQLGDVAKVYGLTRTERLFQVDLPAASPRIFSGLQVSLQVSFVVMIASEILGSARGIGAMTLLAQQTFAIADMWAGIILLGILGYLVNLLFNIFRGWILKWYIQSQELGKEM